MGLYCRQELTTWIDTYDMLTDCFTLVSRLPMEYVRTENTDFARFADQMRLCSKLYQR